MSDHVVVIGAGYAGAGAVKAFEKHIEPGEAELTWISEHDYHLVLHEVHRAIRKPEVESKIAIPVDEIKSDTTNFIRNRVTNVDTDEQTVELEDGESVEYDYLLVAIGSETAFFGIEGLKEHSLTLKGLDDARAIHEAIRSATDEATQSEPAQILIGGAGLSGIQTAGEIAEYRDAHRAPLEIKLIEGLDEIFPGQDPEVQGALKKRLLAKDVEILTGDFISAVDEQEVHLGDDGLEYDVLVWTGGITGHEEVADANVEKDDRSNRIFAESDFQTSNERVFAIGDSALIDQGTDEVAPPTAQAAWQAAEIAGENLARSVQGAPLKSWRHKDKGTVVSVGDKAVAHDVIGVPINTFGGPAAKLLKKTIACRWIADVSSTKRAMSAFSDM
ncbi:NAD(P)/FAD-dependent oxidoreductase [Natronocalculus amylovorans]|uniref:FAD-dependent oxidoreductase n=1 Tax=Natronocalculus amylovorans TaxID=2917812 RepID=A0AAE3FX96_9EURY|nr:FAD-dependent oxidoreductase [Natronocalculus amylovorans]MCL9816946.1 FAD-dependent oxidoreductase [Natronocalculus amylovorans]